MHLWSTTHRSLENIEPMMGLAVQLRTPGAELRV
jgi:hypothetical protein